MGHSLKLSILSIVGFVLLMSTATLTSAWLSLPFPTMGLTDRKTTILPRRPCRAPPTTTSFRVSATDQEDKVSVFPELGLDGVYDVRNKDEHQALLEANKDRLVVMKVYAPWCKACKGLEPKFLSIVRDQKYQKLPITWAKLSIQNNKEFVKKIGVIALPTIQFYVGGHISDTFPCGPSKFPVLKQKLAQLVNSNVDPKTLLVKQSSINQAAVSGTTATTKSDVDAALDQGTGAPQNATAEAAPSFTTTGTSATQPLISDMERSKYKSTIPFFGKMTSEDFDAVMDKARILTFDAGAVIMREGKPGRTFYIIRDGEVEICQKTLAEDPMQISGSYLGTVVNRLEKDDYFGERAMMTGEPRAASIRAVERTSCYAFDQSDFPTSSPLSGGSRNDVDLESLDDKYGLGLGSIYVQEIQKIIRETNVASQIRGSANSPRPIRGVDTDDDIWDDDDVDDYTFSPSPQREELVTNSPSTSQSPSSVLSIDVDERQETVFNVLRRFKMIRQLNMVFDYMELANVKWGDSGNRKRRTMLVGRLTPGERQEFEETFNFIDQDHSGRITFSELRRVMDSVLDSKTDGELMDMLIVGGGAVELKPSIADQDRPELTIEDFLGIVAEAEFYFLFREIFRALDQEESGFVKARELDRVLCGVRDLISDDRKSIIDVDDSDMLIDYEEFTRMLLGANV